MISGEVGTGSAVAACVDVQRRRAISRAHTATHLIHRAFRERLGDTATQMGSENAPGRLRFDFPSPTPVARPTLSEVEGLVNDVVMADLTVHAEIMNQEQARSIGAMALFGEKYGEQVRVVSVGDWAHELCGGTHAHRSGQLGVVTFLSEGSIGTGVRRVEALVGTDAYQFLAREHILVSRLGELLKSSTEDIPDRIERLIGSLKEAERSLATLRTAQLSASLDDLLGSPTPCGEVQVWTFEAPKGTHANELRDLVVKARGKVPTGAAVIAGAAEHEGRLAIVVAASDAAISMGASADLLLKAALEPGQGRGGGKPELAQGGSQQPDALSAGFDALVAQLRRSTSD